MVAAATALLCGAAPDRVHAGPRGDVLRIASGLDAAVADRRLSARDAMRHRDTLRAAARALPGLTAPRAAVLAGVLAAVADARPYDRARALTLFSTLHVNTRYLRAAGPPRGGADVVAANGVVYRSYVGVGLRFHPLASFGKLNEYAAKGRTRRTRVLASALVGRARRPGGRLVWEYDFRANGGRPPWTSGLVQAVAAQALARAGYPGHARRAYAGLRRGLLVTRATGPWVRLYSFDATPVLNAQLQAGVSLHEYARRTKDAGAASIARRMLGAAQATLPHFDTGSWSTYSLFGREASVGYHTFVTSLLWKAARIDPSWTPAAARFRDYYRKPPEIRVGTPPRSLYPWPVDGFRDRATLAFWLSKPAGVTLRVAGESHHGWFGSGWQTMTWFPGPRRPGTYALRLDAVDRFGNESSRRLRPVWVRRDARRPRIVARIRGGRLVWRARDAGTPWLRLQLVVRRGGRVRTVSLGNVRHKDARRLPVPLDRTWHLTLVATDSSGNATRVTLGLLRPVKLPLV